MRALCTALILVAVLALINLVACWLGFDVAGEPAQETASVGGGGEGHGSVHKPHDY